MTKGGLQCGGIPGESLGAIRKEEIFHSLGTDIGLDAEGVVNLLPSFSGEKHLVEHHRSGQARPQESSRNGVAELGWGKKGCGYRSVQEGLLRLKQVGYWDEGMYKALVD